MVGTLFISLIPFSGTTLVNDVPIIRQGIERRNAYIQVFTTESPSAVKEVVMGQINPGELPRIDQAPTMEQILEERAEAEEAARLERVAQETEASGQRARPDAISYVMNRAKE